MYKRDWSNELSTAQFVGGSMLLSWDLMPSDSNGVTYLSPRHLGTMKASLRLPKPLLATTTLIPYAHYDILVVVDAYCTVTFDYNAWWLDGNFRRPSEESPRQLGHWSVSTPGTNIGPCLHGYWLPIWSKQLMMGLLGNTGLVFSSRTLPAHFGSTTLPTMRPRSDAF